jgi:hypothetical protein
MTIMSQGDNKGERRCTSACYDAKRDKCVCCCGGANHGKGLRGALEGQEERFGMRKMLVALRGQKELQFI